MGFFFFRNETEREKYNVTVAITLRMSLRGFESFRVLRADLRRELEKESNGKEKRIRLKKNRKKCPFNTGRN